MTTTVQVVLVGGRQTPNVIGVMALRPNRVELLISRDERQATVDNLLETLRSIAGVVAVPDGPRVDPLDVDANRAACEDICNRYPGARIAFNLTGSTKIMALAAYDVARQRSQTAFYVDTAHQRIIPLIGDVPGASIRLTIDDYLQTYGRRARPKREIERLSFSPEVAVAAAECLARNAATTGAWLLVLRSLMKAKQDQMPLPPEGGLQELISLGIFNTDDATLGHFHWRRSEDWNFLNGGWLEVYIWNEMRRQISPDAGQPLLDDCAMGLEIPSGSAVKEIDVVGLFQSQLILCSCKTEAAPFKAASLDELSAVAGLLGGRYCTRVFVASAPLPAGEQGRAFDAQARQREIVVIAGNQLVQAGDILAKETRSPTYWRV